MSVIPALRQEDYFEQDCGKLGLHSMFQASQSYIGLFLRDGRGGGEGGRENKGAYLFRAGGTEKVFAAQD